MADKIGIQSVSELITSKAGRQYFTVQDFEQKRYVCFIPKLKDFCPVGEEIEADLTPGKSPDDSPRIDMIYINGKPVITLEAKATGRAYGKSDKELLQQVRLAEAQNRSIQAQSALNRAVDYTLAEMNREVKAGIDYIGEIEVIAETFYRKLQSLTQISEAEVIHRETKTSKVIKEAPGDKEVPDDKARQMALDKVQKGQRFTEELRLEINKVGFTKEGVMRFIHEMFGIDPTDKSPGMLISELNDAQFKVFEQEIESRREG